MKRGQAAMEYLILVGVLLVVLVPLFNYISYYTGQNIKIDRLDDAVQTLGKTADSLYALGPGNKDYVWITLPSGIIRTDVSLNEILIVTNVFGEESDFYYITKGTVIGSIPNDKGTFKMELEVLETGEIQIAKS
ncbi:class III signal peptide-containing protein [Candidatus Woesearchaeota archaeon]|jgi:uncharacterized protein (UPF0333 family)|nr:class III signal peptide-containing protein [Candidatus Woesearchaeota archaeon]